MTGTLIVAAESDGRPGTDVRVRDGMVVETGAALWPGPGETVLEAHGGAVIPGLHDHHIHLRSAVAASESVALDPATVAAAGGFDVALRRAATDLEPGDWLRGVGAFGDDIRGLDRYALDRIVADRAVRVQHRSGALWLLNSAAVNRLGVDGWTDDGVERLPDGRPTGRLWRLDDRVQSAIAAPRTDQGQGLTRLSQTALRHGITGFTDATADRTPTDIDDLAAHVMAGRIRQRLALMADRRPPDADPSVRILARKVVLDDNRLPSPGDLAALAVTAHDQDLAVAVHCVTADQLVVALSALTGAGVRPGDRIEHAGVVPPGFARTIADLGLTVVTQPAFVHARGDDYAREVPAAERDWLYPCRSLLDAGVAVAAGSDAPFGPLDPWLAMATAVSRQTASGALLGAPERVAPADALRLFLGTAERPGRPRRVRVGEPGDLCVLRAPLAEVLSDLGAHQVAAVLLRGEVVVCNA